DPVQPPAGPEDEPPDQTDPAAPERPDDEQVPDQDDQAADPDEALPQVEYDLGKLPEPVQALRNQILEAAKSGDIEKLRPLLGEGDDQTQLALGGINGDPITYLKDLAGDE